MAGAQVVAEPGDDERDRLDLRRAGLQPVERDREVGGVGLGVDVLGRGLAVAALAPDDLGRIGELARGRDQRHGAHQALGRLAVEDRPEHLEGELRQPVAEALERQLLEDDIGRAAIGRGVRRAHLRGDERVGLLALAALVQPQGDAVAAHELAVGPDAADAGDRSLAERDREAREVEVLGDLGAAASAAALAAALLGGAGLLAEVGRPDDVAAGAHRAVDARDHRALGRGGDLQGVEPLAGDPLRRRHRGDEPGVDRGAGDRADGAADRRRGDAEDRAADRAADRGAGGGEDDRGHGISSGSGTGRRRRCAGARRRRAAPRRRRCARRRG